MVSRKQSGLSLYVFLAILCFIYTLMIDTTWRLTNSGTQLTQHLIAEHSIHYMCDNACALARDYIRSWTSGGNAPNILLHPKAFDPNDSAGYVKTGVLNLNALLDLENRDIIWPRKIFTVGNDGKEITKNDEKDDDVISKQIKLTANFNQIRFTKASNSDIYEADLVFGLRAKGKSDAGWVLRNRVFHVFEHIKIVRKPLTSYQLFADGDFSLYSFPGLNLNFTGPVHINGNLYLAPCSIGTATTGNNSSLMSFTQPVSIGGHLLRLAYGSNGEKINLNRTSTLYDDTHSDTGRNYLSSTCNPSIFSKSITVPTAKSGTITTSTGALNSIGNTFFAKSVFSGTLADGYSYRISNTDYLTSNRNGHSYSDSGTKTFPSFEVLSFYRWRFWPEARIGYWSKDSPWPSWNNTATSTKLTPFPYLLTKQPWIRLSGYDPTQFNSEVSTPTNATTLESNFGSYALLKPKTSWNASVTTAVQAIRKDYTGFTISGQTLQDPSLTPAQVQEKYRVLESQKMVNQPGLFIKVNANTAFDCTKVTLEGQTSGFYNSGIYKKLKETRPYVLYKQEDFAKADIDTARAAVWGHVLRAKYLGVSTNTPIKNLEAFRQSSGGSGELTQVTENTAKGQELVYRNLSSSTVAEGNYNGFLTLSGEQKIPDININLQNVCTFSATPMFKGQLPYILFDKNRRKWIQLIDIDVGKLRTAFNNNPNWNNFIGITGSDNQNFNLNILKTGLKDLRTDYRAEHAKDANVKSDANIPYYFTGIGVRLRNASQLPTNGLTIFSQFPVYIQGDYNTTSTVQKAAIIADSITVLSNQWQDYTSRLSSTHSLKPAITADVTVNAHLITGTPHPDFMITNNATIPEAGLLSVIRILEDWHVNSKKIKLGGGIIIPFRSKIAWEPWCTTNESINNDKTITGNILKSVAPIVLEPKLSFTTPQNPPGCPFVYEAKYSKPTHYTIDNSRNRLRDITVGDFDNLHAN